MAIYDSAWCLERFNQLTGRPSAPVTDSIDDTAKYVRLSEAQVAVVADIMVRHAAMLNPKMPYPMFPLSAPNQLTNGTGTITLSGVSFAAGATLTATASVAQFSAGSVGRVYLITDPTTRIPLTVTVTAYTSTTVVSMTCELAIPASMQAVAISGWGLVNTYAPDNQVFTFGVTADGYPIMPMGKARIYENINSWPDYPMVEGFDYVNEGTQIRLPNDRSWDAPLYWYGVVQPPQISATSQPVLFPEGSRELITFKAASVFADEAVNNTALADRMEGRYQQAFARWMAAWKTQFSSGGLLGNLTGLKIGELGGTTNGVRFNHFGA